MKRICVFAGSASGGRPAHADAARKLGAELVRRGIDLVYGAGRVGLMGELADAVLASGGHVIGVIPHALRRKEVVHDGIQDLRVVETMHERKAQMAAEADGFLALPGGVGTLEELSEVFTWAQLGIHDKPCALLDVEGYYRPLLEFFDRAVRNEFLRIQHRDMLLVGDEPALLLDRMASYTAPERTKWLAEGET